MADDPGGTLLPPEVAAGLQIWLDSGAAALLGYPGPPRLGDDCAEGCRVMDCLGVVWVFQGHASGYRWVQEPTPDVTVEAP